MTEFASGGRAFCLSEETGRLDVVRRDEVPLSPIQAAILRAFLRAPGRQLSEAELASAAWAEAAVPEGAVAHAVRGLMVALGDDPAAPLFIEAMPQRGYRFLAGEARGADDAATVLDALADPCTDRTKPNYVGPALRAARRIGEEAEFGPSYFVALAQLDDVLGAATPGRPVRLPVLTLEVIMDELQNAA